MKKIAVLLIPVILLIISCTSGIKEDENLVFFPTYGYISQEGMAVLEIHGQIYELEPHSRVRNQLLERLRKVVGLQESDKEYSFYEKRARLFMVDNERNKIISIRLGSDTYTLNKSGPNGHFTTIITMNPEDLQNSLGTDGIISFQAYYACR